MKSRYYKILGLPDNATDDEVRKQYRKLVMRYHPDKNMAPGAEKRFIEIKEAYEIVIGKSPLPRALKNAPTTTRRKNTPKNHSGNEEAEMRRRAAEAQERLRNQKLREHIENEMYFRKLTTGFRWKIMRVSAVLGMVLAIFMMADLVLPRHYERDVITSYNLNPANGIGGSRVSLIQTEDAGFFWIERMNYSLYGGNHELWIETSWMFHNPVRILAQDKVRMYGFHVNFNFFRLTFLMVPIFLLPAFTLWYKRRKVAFTVLFQFSFYGVNGLMLFYLLTGDRWAHIFSLGFL